MQKLLKQIVQSLVKLIVPVYRSQNKYFRKIVLQPLFALRSISLRFLDRLLTSVYSSPNRWVRRIFQHPLFALRRVILFVRSGFWLNVNRFEGQAAGSNMPIRVAYLGEGRGMDFMASRLFAGEYQQEVQGRANFINQAQAAEELAKAVDLVVIERNSLLSWKPSYGEWAVVPSWVRMVMELDLTKSWQEIERGFKRQERNIRRFKRAGYTFSISKREEDFDFFFDRMYVPMVTNRHKNTALIESREHFFSLFKQGFLLFITNPAGERVAADLDYLCGDTFFAIACGVLDGDEKIMEDGALSALYYYALQWCHEHCYRRCDVCEVRPWEDDGIYQYKRRWGFQPVPELWITREWLLWVPDGSPAAQHWLDAQCFLPEFTCRSPRSHPVKMGEVAAD